MAARAIFCLEAADVFGKLVVWQCAARTLHAQSLAPSARCSWFDITCGDAGDDGVEEGDRSGLVIDDEVSYTAAISACSSGELQHSEGDQVALDPYELEDWSGCTTSCARDLHVLECEGSFGIGKPDVFSYPAAISTLLVDYDCKGCHIAGTIMKPRPGDRSRLGAFGLVAYRKTADSQAGNRGAFQAKEISYNAAISTCRRNCQSIVPVVGGACICDQLNTIQSENTDPDIFSCNAVISACDEVDTGDAVGGDSIGLAATVDDVLTCQSAISACQKVGIVGSVGIIPEKLSKNVGVCDCVLNRLMSRCEAFAYAGEFNYEDLLIIARLARAALQA